MTGSTQEGFTLIEEPLVVVVRGILAAVAVMNLAGVAKGAPNGATAYLSSFSTSSDIRHGDYGAHVQRSHPRGEFECGGPANSGHRFVVFHERRLDERDHEHGAHRSGHRHRRARRDSRSWGSREFRDEDGEGKDHVP